MELMFIGADHEVTGSCYYLEAAGKRFLVDYGMEQGNNVYVNAELPCPASDIDFVLLTHAHKVLRRKSRNTCIAQYAWIWRNRTLYIQSDSKRRRRVG